MNVFEWWAVIGGCVFVWGLIGYVCVSGGVIVMDVVSDGVIGVVCESGGM